MKRFVHSLFLVAFVLGLSLCFMDSAFSIPTSQQDCGFDVRMTSSTSFVLVPGSIVTVQNGFSYRNCVIQFSAEADATPNDFVGIRYSIDGGACSVFGPQIFHAPGAIAPGGTETHTNISVVQLGSGVHTIQSRFVLFDNAPVGGTAILGFRCLVVECRTQ